MSRKKVVIFLLIVISCLFLLATGSMVVKDTLAAPGPKYAYPATAFGITIDYASYRYPGYSRGTFSVDKSKKQIDLAKGLGVDYVRFDIRDEAVNYPEEVEKLDEIIEYARLRNLKILIGVYGRETLYTNDFLSYPYGGSGKASWKEFKQMYTNETKFLVKRYHPDYVIIVPECPFNIGNQVNSVRTISEWVNYTKGLASIIRQESPGTEIVLNEIPHKNGAQGAADYEFTEAIMKDGSGLIDVIGSDSYNYDDLKTDLRNLSELKSRYHWQGKLWVTEANLVENVELFTRPSTPEEDRNQAHYFVYAINLASKSGFSGFCVFNFTDDANDGGCGWGITYSDFTPKPAYYAIKRAIQMKRLRLHIRALPPWYKRFVPFLP